MNEADLNTRRRKKVAWIALAAGLLVLFAVWIARPSPILIEAAQVANGTFEETFKTDGKLRAKDRYVVPAFATGEIVKRVTLRVGDEIKKGDPITDLFWDKTLAVRSPISGVVSQVFRESTGPIERGAPIIEIVDPSKIEVVAELLTPDAVRVHVGTPIKVEGWGGPPLAGKVTRISKAGFVKPSALGVEEERTEVVADLTSGDQNILSAMGNNFHVDVTFMLSRRENVLQIPVGALFRDGSHWAVYVVDSNRARKRNIEVGTKSESAAEVLSGVHIGETVILYPGDLVKESTTVRLRKSR